jgi:lysophospholipase L1-like esterase
MEPDPMILPRRLPSLFAIAFSLLAAAPVPGDAAPFDPRTIVFIGSSSIEFWKSLPEDFAGHKVMNLGKAGTTYSHLVAHAGEWGAKYPADRYVIYSGDNDIAWLRSPAKVAGQFREVARALKAANPRVHIFVISIKPNVIPTRRIRIGAVRKANAMIAAEAAALGHVTYVDTHTAMLGPQGNPRAELFSIDGIHLNQKGYRVWRDVLRPILEPPLAMSAIPVAQPSGY